MSGTKQLVEKDLTAKQGSGILLLQEQKTASIYSESGINSEKQTCTHQEH